MGVALALLRSADLECTSRQNGITAATLCEWREVFLAPGGEGLEICREDPGGEQSRRRKPVIPKPATENELLWERRRRMEDRKPYLEWRSRK